MCPGARATTGGIGGAVPERRAAGLNQPSSLAGDGVDLYYGAWTGSWGATSAIYCAPK